MRKILLHMAVLGAVLVPSAAFSGDQVPTGIDGIVVSDIRMIALADELRLEMTLDVASDAVSTIQGMAVIPTLTGPEGEEAAFPQVLVNGRNRARIYERQVKLGSIDSAQAPPFRVITIDGKSEGVRIDYSARISPEAWMEETSLNLVYELISPAGERRSYTIPVSDIYLEREQTPSAQIPSPQVSVPQTPVYTPPVDETPETTPATPPTVESVVQTVSGSAQLDFETATSELVPSFGGNGRELREIEQTFAQISATPGERIVSVTITGYSSPEGRYDVNTTLAHNRAQALARYLRKHYALPEGIIRPRAVGEDWSGLRASIAAAGEAYPPDVMRIIDSADAPDAKESRLRRLDGGRVWQRMEREIFPLMRRVEYSIDFR